MESNLGLMLEHSWALKMDHLMIPIMASSRAYCLEAH